MKPKGIRHHHPWWLVIFDVVDRSPISEDDKERLRHFTVFVLIGMPALALFGIHNYFRANYLLCAMIMVTDIGIVVGWLVLTRQRNGQIIYRILCGFYFSLVMYMVIIGGQSGSKILWMYSFPLSAFFLLGWREGLFWACCVVSIAAILLWVPLGWLSVYPYHPEFKIRFLSSFLVVTFITYWFERFRHHYKRGMQREHQQLEMEKQHLHTEIIERKKAEKEKEILIAQLKETLEKVNTLRGLIPICANCHSIRDDQGYWNNLEGYIQKYSDAEFSHGICPECRKKLYPDLYPVE